MALNELIEEPTTEGPPTPASGAHLAYAGASRVLTAGNTADVGTTSPGTTNIDFSDALYSSVQQIRGYRQTKIALGHDGVRPTPEGRKETLEKKIQVPDSWLRGFLQVQSAATLPFDHVQLS